VSTRSAIAAVTATLSSRLTRAIDGIPGISGSVSHTRPGTTNVFPSKVGVHLFLYMVTPNGSLRNNDLPTRDGRGQFAARPTAALDLHYLLSFVGEDAKFEPQLMLGAVTVDLHANPVLTPDEIALAVQAAELEESKLEQQIDRVRMTSEAINLDEFSKLWSVFFQTQYLLSVAYKASVLLLEADVATLVPARVRRRDVWSAPLPPTLVSVTPQVLGPGGHVVLRGRGFLGTDTKIRFLQADGSKADVPPTLLLDERLEVDLPANLSAGVIAIQVITTQEAGSGDSARSFELESGALPFTLAPRLVQGVQQLVAVAGTLGGQLAFDFVPPLADGQELVVLVGSLRFEASSVTTTASKTNVVIELDDPALVPGTTYPLRVSVDRAQSLIDEDGPTGFKPRLELGGP
jgi:hypothetical protein